MQLPRWAVLDKSGESGYRCWRNATGRRGAVKGKRVGLELEAATVRHYTGFRVFAISVLVI
jgi:hypothetical protein